MHTSDRATTPTREARVMAFLGSHDLVGIPAGEPNLTVRELLIAVHRVNVARPAPPCAPPPERATLRCVPGQPAGSPLTEPEPARPPQWESLYHGGNPFTAFLPPDSGRVR
ncbi:hypothetical protein [Streptomyces asiaticus]|uniref:hypothetical protein n=1 Tax=Streptomyces asiaticus TaxID=114695 RepID=UPI0038004F12